MMGRCGYCEALTRLIGLYGDGVAEIQYLCSATYAMLCYYYSIHGCDYVCLWLCLSLWIMSDFGVWDSWLVQYTMPCYDMIQYDIL